MTKKILFLVFGFIAIQIATVSATVLSAKKIKKLHVNADSGIYFQTYAAMQDPDGCGSISWYHVARNSIYEKEIYSLLLAARTSGAEVTFYIDGCDGGYPRVTYINTHD